MTDTVTAAPSQRAGAAVYPGPAALGRGIVIGPGADVPPAFADAVHVRVDDEVLATPRHAADVLHRAWARRDRVVVELAVPNEALREPEASTEPPYSLGGHFGFDRERLFFLVWANNYDLRSGAPQWHLASHYAAALGATTGTATDVVLPDGQPAWIDGGPRGPVGVEAAVVHRESLMLGRLSVGAAPEPTEQLAPDQLAAVRHAAGPARIIAPAGSGKTRVLTARLRHLLRDRAYEPRIVTAVAYNTRAAAEMRDRTTDLDASIRTLHSLGLWICNQVERREVIDEREVRSILDRLVTTGKVPNQDPFKPYLEALAEIRLGLRDPQAVEAERDDVDGLAELFPRYREELARRNAIDFDEQIYGAIELLLADPDLRKRVQVHGQHLLVDEFQDLTPAFLLLVRLVASSALQVFGVGDDDQVIYQYAGATPDFLIDFDDHFPGAREYALEVNYRCPPTVVEHASTLLGHNRRRISKDIRPAPGRVPADHDIAIHRVERDAMADRAVSVLADWLDGEREAREVTVLARVNSALLPIQVALTHAGIPHTAPLDAQTLGRTGLRTALAWLRLGLDPERMRRDDVHETLRRPSRRVITAVREELRKRRTWTLDGLREIAAFLDGSKGDRLAGYCDDIANLTDAITAGADTQRCLWIIRNRIGLGEAMDTLDSSRTRPEGSSHGDDLDALEQLAALHPDPGTFREWLVDQLRVPGDPDGVTLSTVHRVKGMEWEDVLVFAANAGLLPHRLSDDHEEERRVFHVAVTRCRSRLAVVANSAAASPFLQELVTAAPAHVEPPAQQPPQSQPALPATADGDDGSAVAVVGLSLTVAGGFAGTVAEVSTSGVKLALRGGTTLHVGYGETVTTDAGRRTLVAPRPRREAPTERGAPDDPEVQARFEALRAWRADKAREESRPAYTVLHDAHLLDIAESAPTSLVQLSRCRGIGPAKLDRYGDEILTVLEG